MENKKLGALLFAWNPEDSRWTVEEYKKACLKVKKW